MRSVADIPGDDTEDDLSGISPELVLIDPELARLVRERQVDKPSPAARTRAPTLRLVEGGPAERAIVPRAVETASAPPVAPSAEPVTSSVPAPVVEPPREEVAPVASSMSAPLVDEPVVDALPIPVSEPGPVARRVIDAEPARAVPSPDVEAPAPLLPDRLADFTVPPSQPAPAFSTMPHPVARPATQRPARATAGRQKRGRARGILAFLLAVAVASAAVLGITRLTSGSSEGTSGKSGTAAVGAPPVAAKSGSKTKTASSTKKATTKKPAAPKPKPAASKPAVSKPAVTQKKAGANASTKPKPTVTAKPKTQTAAKPKPKPQPTTAKPKAAAPPPKKTAAAPAAAETRRFAWAPVDGAVGYHVELFRGNDRVLAKDTKEPVLELAPSWRYQGRTVTLTPGEYRWYVWPVTASGRGAQAVVQAKLTV
ncbi:MAG TPA: hypothetical protein VF073_03905 [Gaiella sp.]